MNQLSGIEYHYAPMTGELLKVVKGVKVIVNSFEEKHEILKEFLEERRQGIITLAKTVNYGSELFHGHSGKVDIYNGN